MHPVPQGGVVVRSHPPGAGRRGRGEPYDWDENIEWVRVFLPTYAPGTEVWWDYVPAGSVPALRERYPDCKFRTFATRLQQSVQRERPTTVCVVYVSLKEAGNGDEAEPEAEAR